MRNLLPFADTSGIESKEAIPVSMKTASSRHCLTDGCFLSTSISDFSGVLPSDQRRITSGLSHACSSDRSSR